VKVASRQMGGRVQVRPGDTLSQIAFRYYGDRTRTRPIIQENRLPSDTLRPGQFLSIPPLVGDQ
ncbi:MAG: LysM peptidoglycan-binding domain-containing protein, partial [Myxococcota bacterium]